MWTEALLQIKKYPDTCGRGLNVQTLGSERNLNQYVNEFIQIISLFEQSFLNSGARLLLESRSVIVIKRAAFFTHLRETNNGIQLTDFFSSSVSGCGCGFGFELKYWLIDDLILKVLK